MAAAESAKTANRLPARVALLGFGGGDVMVNIRDISIKCGNCGTYQTLTTFARRDDWNVYTFECDNSRCDPAVTRTLVEVPAEVDEFARRDPQWRGGGRHGAFGDGSS